MTTDALAEASNHDVPGPTADVDPNLWPAIVLLGGGIGLGFALRDTVLGPAIGVAVLLGLAYLSIRAWGRRDLALQVVLFGALALRLSILGFDEVTNLLPREDAVTYHWHAEDIAREWLGHGEWTGKGHWETTLWKGILAVPYFLFGSSEVLGRVFNAALSVTALYHVFLIGREVFDRRSALFGTAAYGLIPSVAWFHGDTLREATILLAFVHVLYVLFRGHESSWTQRFTGLVALAVLVILRRGVFVSAIPGMLALVLLFSDRTDFVDDPIAVVEQISARTVGGFLCLGAVILATAATVAEKASLSLYTDKLSPEALTDMRDNFSRGGSSYFEGQVFHNWWEVVAFVPLGATYFLLTPFPWQIHNTFAAAAVAENLLFLYPIVALGVVGMKREALSSLRSMALLALLAVPAALFGMIEGNAGTAIRHRLHFVWIFCLFAGTLLASEYEHRVWWE